MWIEKCVLCFKRKHVFFQNKYHVNISNNTNNKQTFFAEIMHFESFKNAENIIVMLSVTCVLVMYTIRWSTIHHECGQHFTLTLWFPWVPWTPWIQVAFIYYYTLYAVNCWVQNSRNSTTIVFWIAYSLHKDIERKRNHSKLPIEKDKLSMANNWVFVSLNIWKI